jgi:hypothetical protein
LTSKHSLSPKKIFSSVVSSPSVPGRKLLLAGLALILLSLGNCKKPEDIGIGTLPEKDLVYTDYSDTATVLTYTIKEDSLRADELSRSLFGSIKDPDFGLTDVSFFTQVLLSSTPNLISDSSDYGADSLVLALAYTGSYGDTLQPVNIHVYRLSEDMHIDSSYYSNRSFQTEPDDLVESGNPFMIRPELPVVIGSDTNQVPQLRLRLDSALRDEIFAKNQHDEFASNDNWKAYFKGLQVKMDQVTGIGGTLVYFNPSNTESKMTLYYHEGTTSKSYSFTMSGAASVTNTVHDFTGTPAATQLQDPTGVYEVNYLKALAGLKTVLSFPYLKHFVDSGSILINKAELVINVLSDTLVPGYILLLAKNASGTYEFPIDYYERSYGGSYELLPRTYTFNISRTVQHILDGTDFDYGFSLNILGSMISGNSVAIGGGKTGISQMKLKLYYTKLH